MLNIFVKIFCEKQCMVAFVLKTDSLLLSLNVNTVNYTLSINSEHKKRFSKNK